MQPTNRHRKPKSLPVSWQGFTLPELLVSLLILGEIATFTIPKIVTAQQKSRHNAIVKEAISSISGALEVRRAEGLLSTSDMAISLIPYLNYARTDTSAFTFDNVQSLGIIGNDGRSALRLHNGALLWPGAGAFSGTATTNAIMFYIDPDGQVTDGTTNGPGKSVQAFFYYNGRVSASGSILPGTVYNGNVLSPAPWADPPWFSW